MRRGVFRWTRGSLLASMLLLLGGCTAGKDYSSEVHDVIEGSKRESARLLEENSRVEDADVAIGVSEGALRDSLASLAGIKAALKDPRGVELRIDSIDANLRFGVIQSDIAIVASKEGVPFRGKIVAESFLVFDRISEATGGGRPRAHFRFVVSKVSLGAGIGHLFLSTPEWVDQLIAMNVVKAFSEELTFDLPLDVPLELPLGFAEDYSPVTDGGKGKHLIKVRLPESNLLEGMDVRITPPILLDDGVWFLARTRPSDLRDSTDLADASGAENAAPASEPGFPELKSDVQIYFMRSFFELLPARFNNLSNESRRLTANLVATQGHLKKDYSKVDVIGEGGYYVNFKNPTSFNAALDMGSVSGAWTSDGRYTVSGQPQLSARADFEVHIDPFIGGGFDFTAGVNGSSAIPFSVTPVLKHVVSDANRSLIVLAGQVACNQVELELLAGGEVEFGARVYFNVGGTPLGPLVLISSDADWDEIISKDDSSNVVFTEATYFNLGVSPKAVQATAFGYVAEIDVSPQIEFGLNPPSVGSSTNVTEELAELRESLRLPCPATRDPVFLFAGEDFGPNNQIVKALREVIRAYEKAGHNLDKAKERLERVARNPDETDEVLKEIAANTGQTVETVLHQTEANINGLERAAKKVLRKLKF